MVLFLYDKTFEGLLSCIFFAYAQKRFPDMILSATDQQPLFADERYVVDTDKEKASRVWSSLEKKLSKIARKMMMSVWISGLPGTEMLLFRYIRKNLDHPQGVELNFGDTDVLRVKEIAQQISREAHRIVQFVRFQETADGIWFAPIAPRYNMLPVVVNQFRSRYATQPWILYDTTRNRGLYWDTHTVQDVSFSPADLAELRLGQLEGEKQSDDEQLFQQIWREYFRSITIRERLNPKLQQQHMPKKYWKYLTELQQ